MTNDGFQPDRPPIFLSERTEETAQPDIGKTDIEKAWAIAAISSRILKASILAAIMTAIGIAVLSVDNPASLVANLTDWASDRPALQPDADPPAPAIPSTAGTQDTQDLPAAAPPREEIAAAVEPAGQSQLAGQGPPAEQNQPVQQNQADTGQPVTEALFKQFQAWADAEEARAHAAQPAPVPVAQDAPAPIRSTKKHRRVRPAQNARAEIRPPQHHRAKLREEQDARGQPPPVADPRLQDPSAQNVQPPSLLQSLGLSN
jgi:hypothetical protein